MEDLVAKRRGLEDEILRLADEESRIDSELHEYFSSIVGGQRYSSHSSNSSSTAPITKHHASINKTAAHSGNVKSSKISFDSLDISSNILRIEKFGPSFEAMQQDSKKLISQIDDCRQLSERLSSIVRRLDVMQIRSQQALACTEDIINLKECKTRIIAAIEENNLSSAVSYLRQVKDIDPVAARSSDDYEIIKSKELEIKRMVQVEFQKAIEDSNIKSVMSLCPLLQTLGLESEARDNFLTFIEKTVFIAVSADAASVDGATDPATAYAKSLSSVFNSSYIIIQQYLPMVIQGMENSLGDVFFIRRLHKKSESEAGSVLKRYMKYRNLRDIINSLKTTSATTAAATATSTNAKQVSPAEVHCIMDELALLIQYCCRYAKFLKQICTGAEAKSRVRPGGVGGSNDTTGVVVVAVFTGPTEFDKMVDELINKYYMEGETWLMRQGVSKALPRGVATTTTTTAVDLQESIHLDECFFMLQKCGLRSIATNNIHAACAVLHTISDLLSTDLVAHANSMLTSATTQIAAIMQEHINKFKKSIANTASGDDPSSSAGPSVRGFKNAFLLGASSSSVQTSDTSGEGIRLHEEGGFILVSSHHVKGDPWGVASMTEAFNVIELCVRYTDRLNKDISEAGGVVFANSSSSSSTSPDSSSGSSDRSKSSATNKSAKTPSPQVVFSHVSTELDKLKLCTEDFEAAKHLFSNTLRQYAEKLVSVAQQLMKEIFTATLGRQAPLGGVRFDESDATFDNQPALNLLPRILCLPMETIINICTFNISSEGSKDMIVGMLTDACCDRLEHFINQSTFRFAGALKLEEIIRSLTTLFSRYSAVPVRARFSRLREIMLVLTSDAGSSSSGTSSLFNDNFTHLTASEIEAFISLRMDRMQK